MGTFIWWKCNFVSHKTVVKNYSEHICREHVLRLLERDNSLVYNTKKVIYTYNFCKKSKVRKGRQIVFIDVFLTD